MAAIAWAVRERASEDSIAGMERGACGSNDDRPGQIVAGRVYCL